MGEIELKTYNDLARVAQDVVKSGLTAFKSPEQAIVLMLQADAEGLHPMRALAEYNIIQGRPALRSDAMLARFQRSGGKVRWIERSDTAVEAEFYHPALMDPVRVRWTLDQAKKAGLANKQNWKQYPRQMLTARVISEGVRIAYPAVVTGVYTPEEVADFDAAPEPVRVEAELVGADTVSPAESPSAPGPKRAPAPDTAPAPEAASSPAQPASDRKLTAEQAREIGAMLKALGITGKKTGRALITAIIGREYGQVSDLTAVEGVRVMEAIEKIDAALAEADVPVENRGSYLAAVLEAGELPPTSAEDVRQDYAAWAALGESEK